MSASIEAPVAVGKRTTGGPARPRRGLHSRLARREAGAAYLFISPWIFGFIVFTAGPMVAAAYFSLTDYDVLQPPAWVGLQNYQQIFSSDDQFRTALINTVIYTLMYVPARLVIALMLALLLNRQVRGVPLWRTFFYIPAITPVVALAVLWRAILNPNSGIVNQVLGFFGIPGPGWTTDPNWIKPALVLMSLWTVGNSMLILLAGLKNVPRDLYEAAMVDGAGSIARFFHVTLPQISGVIFFLVVIDTIAALQTFTQSVVLLDENGGSGSAGLLYVMYLFNQAFRYFHMGYASALAWILFVVIVAFTALQFQLSSFWVHYEGGESR